MHHRGGMTSDPCDRGHPGSRSNRALQTIQQKHGDESGRRLDGPAVRDADGVKMSKHPNRGNGCLRQCEAAVASLALALLVMWPGPTRGSQAAPQFAGAADSILAAIPAGPAHDLLAEVLAQNPDLGAQTAAAEATGQVVHQAGALPDPTLGLTSYLQDPETRVGPQQAMLSLSQKIPWFGKLRLRKRAAAQDAEAAWARLEASRLQLLTQARGLYYELGFLDEYEQVVRTDRATLDHYEQLARTRYASGVGLQQAVVKLQAEITRADARLLDIAARRADLIARFNALRGGPRAAPLTVAPVPPVPEYRPDAELLRRRAIAGRPEVDEADAQIARSETLVGLARNENAPDLTIGFSYGFVGDRSDPAGRLNPPPDNGRDVLGVTAGITLPIWRGRISAQVAEARLRARGSEESRRAVVTRIDQTLNDLMQRLPLIWERVRLLEDELSVQADQSLRSAEAGYAAGTANALDLLDAERVLLDVRIASARARTDYAVALAQLEGAVGAPLSSLAMQEEQE
jgi:cobalt-zinc-cadmium efflux system outer membrane protein